MGEGLYWDQVEIEDEEISQEDIDNAENNGKLPAMKFLGTCESSVPSEAKMTDYTGYQAGLKWVIDEVIECPVGTAASDKDKAQYEGRFQFDNILLGHPDEADWAKNRRIIVAKRCGLISGNEKIPGNAWSDLIVGTQAIITTEEKASKKDPTKSYVNVAFDGYLSVEESTNSDSFDDI